VKKPKVLLTRDDFAIVAKKYAFVEGHGLAGIAALCDDGSTKFFTDIRSPTYKQYFKIDLPDDASYETKKCAVLKAADWKFPDEFQWAETDERGDIIPGTDTDERLTKWLNSKVDDEGILEAWGGTTMSEYAPGFALMRSLSEEDIKRLDLREGNLASPGTWVPCVVSQASLEDLNEVIAGKDLPFIFVDDEGSSEM